MTASRGALQRCFSVADLRRLAKRKLPRPIFDSLEGGADDEVTVRDNINRFDDWRLVPRTLKGVAHIDPSTTVLGEKLAFPLFLSPAGTSRIFHPDGERAVARAAMSAGTLYVLSTVSSVSIEEVAAASAGPKCFQIYVFKDRGLTREFMARAKRAGFTSLCVTVDVPVGAHRERDLRNGLTFPLAVRLDTVLQVLRRPSWMIRYLLAAPPTIANLADWAGREKSNFNSAAQFVHEQLDPSLEWQDLDWIASEWNGPVAIKGILSPADAKSAVHAGATAIMVSNHGGRQLDSALSPIAALPHIVEAVGDRAEVILDGGVRRGTHVLKALALGARACMLGRPYLYGLAAGGQAGVARILELLKAEIVRDMALMGARCPVDITRDMIVEALRTQDLGAPMV